VVKRDDLAGMRKICKLKGMAIAAMPVPDTLSVFVIVVLGIMNEEIGSQRKLIA
jgi:hypothetical protein